MVSRRAFLAAGSAPVLTLYNHFDGSGGVATDESDDNDDDWSWSFEYCEDPTWDTDADPIEVGIFHEVGYEANAEVVRSYTECALADAFGAEYCIDVHIRGSVPPSISSLNDFIDWMKAEGNSWSKDATHCMATSSQGAAASYASIAKPKRESKLDPDCVKPDGWGDEHLDVNVHLHEIGHSLGFSHKTDSKYYGVLHPMSTTYIDGEHFIHEYHADSQAELDVS